MPFGFNKSDSSTTRTAESQSSSFDNLDASGFSFGQNGSFSTSSSVGSSESGSQAASEGRTRQRVAFSDIFETMFSNASSVAGRLANDTTLLDTANNLFEAGSGFIDTLANPGEAGAFLSDRLSSGMDRAEERIGAVASDVSRFLTEQVNPNITAAGVSAGTLGGPRNQVARGVAGGEAARALAQEATKIRTDESRQLDTIASALLQNETQRAGAGIAGISSLQGIAEAGFNSQLTPFAALSQILGPTTTLTESDTMSASESFGVSEQLQSALSEAFGIDFSQNQTTGRAASQTTSTDSTTSRTRSRGFDIGALFG